MEKTVLNVSVVPAVGAAGFFIALHDGPFAQEGLTVRYIPAVSSKAVIAGQIKSQHDITGGNYVSYRRQQPRSRRGGLRDVACHQASGPGGHRPMG